MKYFFLSKRNTQCRRLGLLLVVACLALSTGCVKTNNTIQPATQAPADASMAENKENEHKLVSLSTDPNRPQPVLESRFGPRKLGKKKKTRMHNGLDISAPTGSDVLAFADGKVISAATTRGYGKCIDIEHADGTVTRYAHMSKLIAQTGDQVKKMERIGLVGRTGRTTGAHLHFEVRKNNQAVDPLPYLASLEEVVNYVAPSQRTTYTASNTKSKKTSTLVAVNTKQRAQSKNKQTILASATTKQKQNATKRSATKTRADQKPLAQSKLLASNSKTTNTALQNNKKATDKAAVSTKSTAKTSPAVKSLPVVSKRAPAKGETKKNTPITGAKKSGQGGA